MKLSVFLFVIIAITCEAQSFDITGAWQSGSNENHITLIITGRYFSTAIYNKVKNTYIGTCGGTWRIEDNQFIEVQEFNTWNQKAIGIEQRSDVTMKSGELVFITKEGSSEFSRIDNGSPGRLAGAWLITGRMTDNGMEKRTPGPRKTMKILSGTRFQWIAYNHETREFFGTGGGTYSTENGKYTENIEFFSRDNSRAGARLQFDFSIEDGNWRHKGMSSKGEPIDEIWTKREKLE